MDQDEKLWQEFNDWHRTRYGWRVHEDLRNHPRENFYAWEAWKAGFANGTKNPSQAVYVVPPTKEDLASQKVMDDRRAVIDKARAAGLTEGDIRMLEGK